MKILSASWLVTCDKNSTIIKNGAIVYNKQIIEVDTKEYIEKKYPNEQIEDLGENSVLMPGLINSHVHLEFSSNTTTLKYGSFISWLNSVISFRNSIVEKTTTKLIDSKLNEMKKTGTTTIGAISSYNFDMDSCIKTPINTVFFSEVIGSKTNMVDAFFLDFKERLNSAKKNQSKNFIPAIAIHSAYSVHPFLLREVLNLTKNDNLAVSSHFLESPEELHWLNKDKGAFLEFFKNLLGEEKAVTKPMAFLKQFEGVKPLSFTHCVETNEEELKKIKELGAIINHCPTSNRLLNSSKLNISNLIDKNISFSIGTDGLSSNNSLSMFDELRNALMIHEDKNILCLSNILLKAATKNGSKALGLNKGELTRQRDADIICLSLPDKVEEEEDLCMNIILHTKFVNRTIIGGEDV